MHGYNVWVPGDSDAASRLDNPFSGVAPFDLAHAMTELMTPGISLPEVAATVTSNLARMLKMEDSIGALLPGREADISVPDLFRGRFTLSDNSGEKVIAHEMLTPGLRFERGR